MSRRGEDLCGSRWASGQVLHSMGRVFQVLQEQLHLAKLVIREQNREHRRQRIILLGQVTNENRG